jgi:hypothetical protein
LIAEAAVSNQNSNFLENPIMPIKNFFNKHNFENLTENTPESNKKEFTEFK